MVTDIILYQVVGSQERLNSIAFRMPSLSPEKVIVLYFGLERPRNPHMIPIPVDRSHVFFPALKAITKYHTAGRPRSAVVCKVQRHCLHAIQHDLRSPPDARILTRTPVRIDHRWIDGNVGSVHNRHDLMNFRLRPGTDLSSGALRSTTAAIVRRWTMSSLGGIFVNDCRRHTGREHASSVDRCKSSTARWQTRRRSPELEGNDGISPTADGRHKTARDNATNVRNSPPLTADSAIARACSVTARVITGLNYATHADRFSCFESVRQTGNNRCCGSALRRARNGTIPRPASRRTNTDGVLALVEIDDVACGSRRRRHPFCAANRQSS